MTHSLSSDVREVVFIQDRVRQDFESLPPPVLETAEAALTALQNNRSLPSKRIARLSGNLSDVLEVKIPFNSDTYRVYHLVAFQEVLYVIEAGMKKSNEKSEIPSWQQATLEERRKSARAHYAANGEEFKRRYEERSALRPEFGTERPRRA